MKAKPSSHPTLPLCLHRKSMLFCRMVDLSILRVLPGSMPPSSLMSTLNWSLRFFSDLFLETLWGSRCVSYSQIPRLRWEVTGLILDERVTLSPFGFILLIFLQSIKNLIPTKKKTFPQALYQWQHNCMHVQGVTKEGRKRGFFKFPIADTYCHK